MAKNGLTVPLESLEHLLSINDPLPPLVTAPAPIALAENFSSTIAQEEAPMKKIMIKAGSTNNSEKGLPRTIYLTDKVYDRLKLMGFAGKCKVSTVIEKLLDDNADKFVFAKVS